MNIALWIVAILLAAAFAMAGLAKLSQAKDRLAPKMPWVNDYSPGTVKFIGTAELIGAIGLILPRATGIAPILTPLAAVGLAIIMVLAAVHHGRKGEKQGVAVNVVLFILSVFVAVGRF